MPKNLEFTNPIHMENQYMIIYKLRQLGNDPTSEGDISMFTFVKQATDQLGQKLLCGFDLKWQTELNNKTHTIEKFLEDFETNFHVKQLRLGVLTQKDWQIDHFTKPPKRKNQQKNYNNQKHIRSYTNNSNKYRTNYNDGDFI